MNKSTFFSGQPVFAQLIGLIPSHLVTSLSAKHEADRYYKRFKCWDHVVTLLYSSFHNCTSLREVITGMEASYNKLIHLKLTHLPRRSTLSDANTHRTEAFFEALYHRLYQHFYGRLPDSRGGRSLEERLFVLDSTTVSFFSDVMKGAGTYGANGRKKGGAKAHVLLRALVDLPHLIYITEASRNDRIAMDRVALSRGDILVFDKGYNHYAKWQSWTEEGINWVTRLSDTAAYQVVQERPVSTEEQKKGVCSDQKIFLGAGTGAQQITVRLVSFYVDRHKKIYHFLTNNFRFKASSIAGLYERRWAIEVFFKRFKQSSPLKAFLGESENSIKIQLWCAFIKDLLLKVLKESLKRSWSFSNLSAMVRHHLMNYIDVVKFLNNPDKVKEAMYKSPPPSPQLLLFAT